MEISAIKIDPKDTILIVDDSPEVREILVDMLDTSSHRCIVAGDAEEALKQLASTCVDLVLTDMQMPGQSGLDLIERIKSIDDSVPVILITGFPSVDTAVDAMKRGAVDFISKPFDYHNVLHLVAKALRERRLRQENRRLQADVNKAAVIEKLNRELNDRLDELTRLYSISEAMTACPDTETIFNHVVNIASQVTGAQRVSVMLLDRGRRHLKIRASLGISDDVIRSTKVRIGQGIAGKVAGSGIPSRVMRHARRSSAESEARGAGQIYWSDSSLSLPLFIGDHTFGVLNLTDKPDRTDFSEKDEHFVRILLEKAGSRLENQALYEGIYANLLDTLNSLVTTIEAKDVYTREHSQRVTDYALKVGEILGLPEEDLEMIDFAGLLHDIGKIGVRDEILTKCGRLTDAEYAAIKEHPLIGEKIVTPLGLTPVERAIIRNHHERMDGRGYPDGLKGDQISFLARVVCVADAFDAMTTTRSYRQALRTDVAMEELRRNSGSQFDPEIVKAMLKGLEEKQIIVRPLGTIEDVAQISQAG